MRFLWYVFALLLVIWLTKISIAAPIPKHLFPPDTEPEVGWTWTFERYPYYLYKIDGKGCWVYLGRPNNPFTLGGNEMIIIGPLAAWEVRALMRGENPDLSRLYRMTNNP